MKRWIAPDIPWYPVAVVPILLVLCVYWQVGNHALVHFDDGLYVYGNPVVSRGLTPGGVSWAFTTFHAGNWHPLTWLSHMLDVELFGPSPGWHHRVNVLYHLLNTGLLFLVLWRMTGGLWQSAFVAALFGVHPLHVESVAWVAERKDVLSTLFWILTMGAYLRYVRRPGIGRYLALTAVFALGLMCKPMLVTLPFVLLLLDGWPLRRVGPSFREAKEVIGEKIPLLALSAVSAVVTYVAQHRVGAVDPEVFAPTGLQAGQRISNAAVSYVAYLWKTVWPASLAVFYPHPATIGVTIPASQVAGALLFLGSVTLLALREARRHPCLAVGWLWYLGTLIPVIGLVQAGAHARADRYTYVPLIGIFMAMAWGIPEVSRGWRFRKPALGALAGLSLVALSVAAWVQTGYWRDSVTLFSRAVAVTERNWFAWNNLGISFHMLGQEDRAISCYREALRIRPDLAHVWFNLGVSHGRLGQFQQAIHEYREALRIKPEYAEARNNLGTVHDMLGQYDQAAFCFREALRIRPDLAAAWVNLGASYDRIGQSRQAIRHYREALRIDPGNAEARNKLSGFHGEPGEPR